MAAAQLASTCDSSSRRTRIAVVDDDERVRRLLRNVFEAAGYLVSEAATEAELAGLLHSHNIALITLDLSLRHEDGLAIARTLRSLSNVPIIMVTGRSEDVDKVVGLELGADDYIVKPFNVREVVARVRAVLRRAQSRSTVPQEKTRDQVRFGRWTLNISARDLTHTDGRSQNLTGAEFDMLTTFVRHSGRVLSRNFLIDCVAGYDAHPLERSVDTIVGRLRKKIEADLTQPNFIKTVRGAGYIFSGTIEAGDPAGK